MKRKASVWLLAAVLGMSSFTGCGSQNENKSGTESVVTEESTDLSEDAAAESTDVSEDVVAAENAAESENVDGSENPSEDKETIICTVFPEYDWVCAILGDKKEEYDVKLLLDSGVDIHSYQPTAEDIAKISDCDMFVYTGGVSESWIEETLESAMNKEMQVIALMDVLGERVKTEEVVEGMEHNHAEEEASDDENHEDELTASNEDTHGDEGHESEEEYEEAHDDHSHESTAYDEHVWLSLKNAQVLVEGLEQALSTLDSENEAVFQANADAYIEKLTALDDAYQTAVDEASNKTVLFGDRFPFRYLTDDYGLDYYAAFTGCSAETEASFETIAFLAGKLDELKLPAVLVIENSDQKLAQTIISSTKEKNQEILVMNSLQSVKSEDVANGVSYLSIMEENLEVLKQALD